MKYVIEVYEYVYCGLHGFSTGGVFEIHSDEIWDYVLELGYDLIDSYSCLTEAHEDEDLEDCLDYVALPIDPKWKDMSTADLDREYANLGWDSFVDKYCCDWN